MLTFWTAPFWFFYSISMSCFYFFFFFSFAPPKSFPPLGFGFYFCCVLLRCIKGQNIPPVKGIKDLHNWGSAVLSLISGSLYWANFQRFSKASSCWEGGCPLHSHSPLQLFRLGEGPQPLHLCQAGPVC